MMKKNTLPLVAALFALSACTGNLDNLNNIGKESDPAKFYALSVAPKAAGEAAQSAPQVIGIGPVSVADYLDRSHIVVRKSPTELELGEFDRWAGKLDKEIQRVLVENLAQGDSNRSVIAHPWRGAVNPDVSVELAIDRFERDVDGKAKLSASWQVFTRDSREPVAFRQWSAEKDAAAGYPALTTALSELVAELSVEVASTLPKP
ncbi:MAG: membrane integrity-associated transporter subunit PqiC [Alphaproteobacteria bacterium]|nr:membrane integrity-associated transporter subunit PqiC [Alphaproteobacteria bacterium]